MATQNSKKKQGAANNARNSLVKDARKALRKAYVLDKENGFMVGAALQAHGRKHPIYHGCNVENKSYGLTMCAERVAVGAAVAEIGKKMRILEIAIVAYKNGKKMNVSPCGACRQVLSEFADKDCIIHYQWNGKLVTSTIEDLLPDAFDL